MSEDFRIIFEKLDEAKNEDVSKEIIEIIQSISDETEIDRLRQIISQINADAVETITYTRAC